MIGTKGFVSVLTSNDKYSFRVESGDVMELWTELMGPTNLDGAKCDAPDS